MGKIGNLYIPANLVIRDILESKPDRGGTIQICIPAISMAEEVTYEFILKDGEKEPELVYNKRTREAKFKFKNRKFWIHGGFRPSLDDDSDWERVQKKYTWIKGRDKEPSEHKVTFYWRRIENSK